jgi:hypothetical protein
MTGTRIAQRDRFAPLESSPLGFRAYVATVGCLFVASLIAIGLIRGVRPPNLLSAGTAQAAEFVVPPGQNVGMQEDLLRERVTRAAKDLVGDKVASVVANIAYLRMDKTQAGTGERIKLPGLNNYVSTSGELQVSSEFVRLRQVVVVVSDELAGKTQTLERDLRAQVELDAAKGDRLEVVTVAAAKGKAPGAGQDATGTSKPESTAAAKEPGVTKDRPPEGPAPTVDGDAMREPKSTLYLINARAAYFRGDYNGALDQILQSINAKPDNPQAYSMLGSLYFAMNWKNLALKYWEKALAQDPGNRELEQLVTQLRTAQN